MLIGFFRKSYLLQYLVLILLATGFWTCSFVNSKPPEPMENTFLMPAYSLLINLFGINALAGVLVAFVLLIIEAFLLNYTLIKNELVPKNALIPAIVYILLLSQSQHLLNLHPVLFSNLFVIIIIYNLLGIYNQEEAYPEIFNAGFWTGIASFFYFPVIFILFFIWLTFIVYRLYKWRDWLIPLTGFITPYIFLYTYFLWSDELFLALNALSEYFSNFTVYPLFNDYQSIDWIIIAIVLLFFLWSFFLLLGQIQEKTIVIRKRYWTLFWLLFISLISYLGSGSLARYHVAMIAIPFTIYISFGFSKIRRKFWFELLFGILILLIIFNNLKDLLLR